MNEQSSCRWDNPVRFVSIALSVAQKALLEKAALPCLPRLGARGKGAEVLGIAEWGFLSRWGWVTLSLRSSHRRLYAVSSLFRNRAVASPSPFCV